MDNVERRRLVAELAGAGVGQRQIARELGVHHSTVQRDMAVLAVAAEPDRRLVRARCEECAGPLFGARLVVCSAGCDVARRRRHNQARWRADPEWRARRTLTTARSLVRRRGVAAPPWAADMVAAASDLTDAPSGVE